MIPARWRKLLGTVYGSPNERCWRQGYVESSSAPAPPPLQHTCLPTLPQSLEPWEHTSTPNTRLQAASDITHWQTARLAKVSPPLYPGPCSFTLYFLSSRGGVQLATLWHWLPMWLCFSQQARKWWCSSSEPKPPEALHTSILTLGVQSPQSPQPSASQWKDIRVRSPQTSQFQLTFPLSADTWASPATISQAWPRPAKPLDGLGSTKS